MLRKIVGEPPAGSGRRVRRTPVALVVAAAAVAALVVAFLTIPGRHGQRSVGSPASTDAGTAAATPHGSDDEATSPGIAAIDPDAPRKATATLTVDGDVQQLTLDGDDVATRFQVAGPRPGPSVWLENRRIDGELYLYVQPQDGGPPHWMHSVGDDTTLSNHPNGSTPFELYQSLTASTGFEEVESAEIDGFAVTHVRASNPADIAQLPLGGADYGTVESLDLWITDAGIVLRYEATLDLGGPEPATVTVEFDDIGSPGIELGAPPDATRVEGEGLTGFMPAA